MNIVNVALQILPIYQENAYEVVDRAIEIIKESGVTYTVCPFETVMEGEYDQLMQIVKDVQLACFEFGAEELLVYVKIQHRKNRPVYIDDKMSKYK